MTVFLSADVLVDSTQPGTRSDGHEALIHGAFEDTQAEFEVIVPARDEES